MARQRLTLLLLLIVCVGAGVLYLWRGLDAERVTSVDELAGSANAAATAGSAALASTSALEASSSEAERARQVSTAASAAHDAELVAQSFALDGALWVEGRVAFPAGMPPDESVQVLAIAIVKQLSKEFLDAKHFPQAFADREPNIESGCWSLAAVSSSGTFRIALPKDALGAKFYLDGRYLDLAPQVVLKDQMSPLVVLQPELGVWVVARCVLPARASAQDTAAGARASLSQAASMMFGRGMGGSARATQVGDDQSLEFRGAKADTELSLVVTPERLVATRKTIDAARAGTKVDVALEFELGAAIRGRVVDEAGSGVAGAVVVAPIVRSSGPRFNRIEPEENRRATSAADGSFELFAVAPGKTRLSAELEGYLFAEGGELELRDEQLVADVVLKLRRGNSISGRVTWPDGSPVQEGSLRAIALEATAKPNGRGRNVQAVIDDQEAQSDANGAFTISGLHEGPCKVVAWAERALPPTAADAPANASASKLAFTLPIPSDGLDDVEDADGSGRKVAVAGASVAWVAEQKDVAVGTKDLVLALAQPSGLRGRVVDEQGAPVVAFNVQVNRDWTPGVVNMDARGMRAGSNSHAFNSADGSFNCPGVANGTWNVRVRAKGFVFSGENVAVEVPQTGELLVITLKQAATISGRVTDPAGKPINDAEVRASLGAETGFGRQQRLGTAKTDEQGQYVLSDLPPGSLMVTATHERWAKSEPTLVTLVGGQKLDDLALTLSNGGNIAGEAFGTDGRGAVGRNVNAFSMGAGAVRPTKVDARGAFLIEHLSPGSYQVMLEPSAREQEALASKMGDEPDMGAVMSSLKLKTVEVKDGETTHVVIGAPPRAPVHLVGRVTERGEPVKSGGTVAAKVDGTDIGGLRSGKVNPNGEYELTLDQPGNVALSYLPKGGRTVRFVAVVPEVPEFHFDLALPLGAITGSVRGPDGAPLANVPVDLQEDDTFSGRMMRNFSPTRTDEGGAFVFEHLQPGTYAVAAGGPGIFDGSQATYGRLVRGSLKISGDGVLEGIVLQLSAPATLTGTVRGPGGTPVGGATIFVRDEHGELVHRFSFIASDANGKFTYRGLTPGRYTACARTATLVSPASASVTVGENTQATVELDAQAGTILRLTLEDEGGKSVQATFSVRDEHERDWGSMFGINEIERSMGEETSTSDKRVGPLPAGKYKVKASTYDGREVSKPVTLSGSDERKLKLRL